MLHRRFVVRGGLAALGTSSVYGPIAAFGQNKPLVKVRYNEVVRSVLYAPAYAAITKGYFKDAGLDVELTTGGAGDKTMAALLSGSADIALAGPETAIYVLNSDSSTKARIFCGLTSTDGFMLMGRTKVDKFDWSALKGKDILGFRPGSTPLLFLEEALRMNGIDPDTDVKLVNNIAPSARVGSWLAGQNEYGIFTEPDPAQLELDGKAYFMASVGGTVGFADYTSFMATDKYIKDNPAIVQTWTDAIYPRPAVDGECVGGRHRRRDRRLFPRRQSAGADQRHRALPEAQDLEDVAGDRTEGDRSIPGHPRPRSRARRGQAGEVQRPRADRIRRQGEVGRGRFRRRRFAEGRVAQCRPALLRLGGRDRGAARTSRCRLRRASSSPSSDRAAAARARCCR